MIEKKIEWVWVPREPTPEMIDEQYAQYGGSGLDMAGRYKAMISAAPIPPIEEKHDLPPKGVQHSHLRMAEQIASFEAKYAEAQKEGSEEVSDDQRAFNNWAARRGLSTTPAKPECPEDGYMSADTEAVWRKWQALEDIPNRSQILHDWLAAK